MSASAGLTYNKAMVRIEITSPNLPEAAKSGGPVEVIDPTTGQLFILISSEQYQKMCKAVSGDFDPREAYPLVDETMREDDADDPLLAFYQQ